MENLNPKALAECGDADLDARDGVQEVDAGMIHEYVISEGKLPRESAGPFAEYIEQNWYDYNEDGELTNGDVIEGALAYWRGGA